MGRPSGQPTFHLSVWNFLRHRVTLPLKERTDYDFKQVLNMKFLRRKAGAERFLIIQLRQLGDVVLTTALARILKEERPGCFVGFLTEEPSYELLKGSPYIDELYLHRRKDSFFNEAKLIFKLRKRRFNAVFDTMSNPTSAIITYLTGAPRRIGYDTTIRRSAYTDAVPRSDGYVVDVKRTLLERYGIKSEWNRPELFLSEEEKSWAEEIKRTLAANAGTTRLFTIDATHKHRYRRWTIDGYAELSKMLSSRYDAAPLALWGPGEEWVVKELAEKSGGAVAVAPQTTVRKMAALIEAADFHIGNCSAPRHIAVAVGTPTFIIPGTSQISWLHPDEEHDIDPFAPPCAECGNKCGGDERKCMLERTAEEIAPYAYRWGDKLFGN